ncbi:AzlD domain-containing protein [Parendozoicomonas sp. Alg238-R29]|uniref:AzlD domain-containing protein n=1 Tax=Parendozoicomonas sp. Alg238-R29 TaxID=2993446 RepID=UPI00248DF4FF|nr:AzlD domain-containing protein [Parendozoicomonas sp. Alg238-R29]
MSLPTLWFVILAGSLGTFLARYSFFWLSGRKALPEEWIRILRFVPPAVLAALIVPGVIAPGLETENPLFNPRIIAALIAITIAWKSKNVMATFAFGMGALWLLQYVETLL